MTAPKSDASCIFCVASTTEDFPGTLMLYRNEHVLVMLNRYPYTNGHVMVAPLAHTAQLYTTPPEVLESLIRVTAESQRILADTYHADGYNVGMNIGQAAGAGIADHYHVHIVPRWGGDSNFMTVTAQTRMVPESLEQTYEKLAPKFRDLRKDFSKVDE